MTYKVITSPSNTVTLECRIGPRHRKRSVTVPSDVDRQSIIKTYEDDGWSLVFWQCEVSTLQQEPLKKVPGSFVWLVFTKEDL